MATLQSDCREWLNALDTASQKKSRYATIRARNAAEIPAALAEFGVDAGPLLQRAGLDPAVFSNPENVLPFTALDRLVKECVQATGCESFGLRVGARMRTTAVGLSGLAAMHAPTVRDALQILTSTLMTSNTGAATALEVRGVRASFAYVVTAANIDSADQIVDAAIAMIFNTMKQLCGSAWRPELVRLTRDGPRDKRPFLRFFESTVEFGAATACVVFDAAALDSPVRDRNPDYATILAPLLEEAAANARPDFLSSIRAIIRGRIGAGALSRETVCRALGLSPRTLNQRLEAHGVTYSALADEAKFEVAQSLLMKDKTIAEVAELLGFADQSAFTRAFKAWSGATPARWRAAQRVADR